MCKTRPFFLFLFCFLLSIEAIEAKTIHAILVADSVNDISHITKPDLNKMRQELKVISRSTQVPLKEKIFTGNEFKSGKLNAYLQAVQFDPTDTVIFYFSGHGYRTKKHTSPLPSMTFEIGQTGVSLKHVADTIWSKKPQFALVMADCCNNFIELGFEQGAKSISINLQTMAPNYAGYNQLFCKAKGCIVVASCSPGEFSFGCCFGGLFTQCFFISLNRELSEASPSWKKLLDRTASYINHIQKPICQVYQ